MRIAVSIGSQQKGFLAGLGAVLAREHEVAFWARDRFVASLLRELVPDLAGGVRVVAEADVQVQPADAVRTALELERRLGVTMALLISHDRALGKGYILNADRHPDIARSWWSHEKKLAMACSGLLRWERLFDQDRPEVILALNHAKELSLVATLRGAHYFSLHPARYGSRLMWSDDDYMTSSALLRDIRRFAAEPPALAEGDLAYAQDALSSHVHGGIDYSLREALRRSAAVVFHDTRQLLCGTRKKDSYRYLGWLPSCLRRNASYAFFRRHGKAPAELAGFRTVYFPLQMEPEISILSLSPEFNNSIEMITWLSKSLPADVLLVVKEQPMSYGVRSRGYYEQFLKMGNVVLARPEVASWEWIRTSAFTATITGTAAVEAVYFGKPVMAFGKHHMVNPLPTARYVNSFDAVYAAVPELLALAGDPGLQDVAVRALCAAQKANSFELENFKRLYASTDLHVAEAEAALDNLFSRFPGAFSQAPAAAQG